MCRAAALPGRFRVAGEDGVAKRPVLAEQVVARAGMAVEAAPIVEHAAGEQPVAGAQQWIITMLCEASPIAW